MKRALLLPLAALTSLGAIAQVNVSTTPQNKKAVLEEYTGNYCTYCPDGHKIAANLEATKNVLTLKIQTGGFSSTDPIFGGTLQTTTGNTIAGPFDSQGYPNGTVSRKASYAGIGRTSWASAVQAINNQVSPVNLYIESSIDVTTRQLDVSVEYYYTASEANATNYLHIGYYQDHIPAFQYDPGFYPSQFYLLEEEVYQFDHCFRDMINGTWGEVINATTMGSTGIVNHTITLPAAFSTFAVEPGAIKVFAWVSQSAQGEILNAEKVTPVYNNFPYTDELGVVFAASGADEGCIDAAGSTSPKVLVANYGSNDLTSFGVNYGVNGTVDSDTWSGSISHNQKVPMTLSPTNFTYIASNNLSIEAVDPNGNTDPTLGDNTDGATFAGVVEKNADKIRIDVKTDAYSYDESSFIVRNGSGATVLSSGPLPNSAITSYFYDVPVGSDCYTIELLDSYGDGWGYNTTAYLRIYNVTGGANTVLRNVGQADNFGSELIVASPLNSAGSTLGLEELAESNFEVYPVPATDKVNVRFEGVNANYDIDLIDLQGRVLYSKSFTNANGTQNLEIDVTDFAKGSYIISFAVNGVKTTKNVTVQ